MNTTTIQQTHKTLKAQKVLSIFLFILGAVLVIATGHDEDAAPFSVYLLCAGLLWYLITKMRIWWNHA